jgi:hypothetical protein
VGRSGAGPALTAARRLYLTGHTGNFVLGMGGGGYLGVGVDPPQAPIDVLGDMQATGEIRAGDLRATGDVYTGQWTVVPGVTAPYVAAGSLTAVQVIGGVIEYTGNKVSGFGFTCLPDTPAGAYLVTFDVAFATLPTVVATPIFNQYQTIENVNRHLSVLVDQITVNGARIVTSDSTQTVNPYALSFIAIGGRA